jgi:hypothetical protein
MDGPPQLVLEQAVGYLVIPIGMTVSKETTVSIAVSLTRKGRRLGERGAVSGTDIDRVVITSLQPVYSSRIRSQIRSKDCCYSCVTRLTRTAAW